MTIFRRHKLRRAYAARDAADVALRRAVIRKDTRAIHAARRALADATHACMRLELL